MSGTNVIRILVILALVITAHTIKPFSVKNVSQHMLYSAQSFSFVLPEPARSSFDDANQLALNLSDSLFEFPEEMGDVTGFGIEEQLALLETEGQAEGPRVEPAARIWAPGDSVRQMRRSKPNVRRSAPAKRIEKNGRFDATNIAAVEFTPQPAPVALPAVLPAFNDDLISLQAMPAVFQGSQESGNCKDSKSALRRLIASVRISNDAHLAFYVSTRLRTASRTDCDKQKPAKPEVIVTEVEAPEAEQNQGMEDEEAEELMQHAAETELKPSAAPLSCPADPMSTEE
jgi:hypothetical protein